MMIMAIPEFSSSMERLGICTVFHFPDLCPTETASIMSPKMTDEVRPARSHDAIF
jgi:hypothetical protein